MDSQENEREMNKLATQLLGELDKNPEAFPEGKTTEDIQLRISQLLQIINFNDWKYYVQSNPVLTDFEYDQLFRALKKLEQEYPEFIAADSPSQRVARGLTKEFHQVRHLVPMLSLENSYNEADLLDWDRKARELTGLHELEYCIEPKFDGAGISLIYENDLLTRGITRGDGITGEDITVNIRKIRSIPLSAGFAAYGINQIEIRGEVMINKDRFKKFNEQRIAENLPPLANPRNAASGSLRMVDSTEVGKRGLMAILYHMSYHSLTDNTPPPPEIRNHADTLRWLSKLGFRSPAGEMKVLKGIQEVIAKCKEAETHRDNLPYEIDGMVIKVNDYQLQDSMGMTSHHPRWAIAFKFAPRQAKSILRKVEFQVGRTGSVTPVAKIDPVHIGGVTISSVSLFNEDVVREKNLRIGDTVLVERAGDVIPYIVKSLEELRDGSETTIVFPVHCPVCGDKLEKGEGESAWRCININCEAQVVERMIHFVSKDAMDIRNLGEANIRRFFNLGMLKEVPGIYHLDLEKIGAMEGFGEKSAANLKSAIEKSKSQPLHRLIFGLGIRYVGETTAKTLAGAVESILEFTDWDESRLLALEDIGPKVAGAIIQFFHNPDNLKIIDKLGQAGVRIAHAGSRKPAGGNLQGKTFLFTGTLSGMKRSEAEEQVEKQGGLLMGSVSSKLDFLVAGADAGSKLEKAKNIHSVVILDEKEFLKMIGPIS
ncbi:MAG TPA: NAD-dependent DNA ligase LigA [Chitinophagaceae bacterium]|nr:NAD-dependent DNA ligase LigA [Chitinophagaceae bacterium]